MKVFNLLGRSMYPFMIGLYVLGLATSMVVYLKYGVMFGVVMSMWSLMTTSAMWFATNTLESLVGGNNFQMMEAMKFSFLLFIFSEVMFFFGIFWAFFDSALSPSVDIGGNWSPMGIMPVNPAGIPLMNTILLLSSGISLTWSYNSLLSNSNSDVSMVMTSVLATGFEVGQYVEFKNTSFSMSDGIFGSVFFFGTGFHGLHVIIGHMFLMINFIFIWNNWITQYNCMSYEFSIVYWHFVDVVWLFLFTFMYVWSYGM